MLQRHFVFILTYFFEILAKLACAVKTGEENLEHIQSTLETAIQTSEHIREVGVLRSSGGHIFRSLKALEPIMTVANVHKINSKVDEEMRRTYLTNAVHLRTAKPIDNHPAWNERFIHGDSLYLPAVIKNQKFKNKSEKEFETIIDEYRNNRSSAVCKSKKKGRNQGKIVSREEAKKRSRAIYNCQSLVKIRVPNMAGVDRDELVSGDNLSFIEDEDSLRASNKMESGVPASELFPEEQKLSFEEITRRDLLQKIEVVWNQIVEDYQACASEVSYKILVELSNLRSPPAQLLPVLGYVCILLGLKPSWQAARSFLLKEISPLMQFFHKVSCHSLLLQK